LGGTVCFGGVFPIVRHAISDGKSRLKENEDMTLK